MAIDPDVLRTLKPEPLDAVAGRVRDGDIRLCADFAADPKVKAIAQIRTR